MRTALETPRVQVRSGRPSMLTVGITNTSQVIDGVSAIVVGIDPAWVQLVLPVVSLFPEASGILTLRFDVPPSCPAGELPLVIRVFSTIDAAEVSEHEATLVVEPIESAELTMRPSLVNGGTSADMAAVITNTGNVATEFRLDAMEPTRALECNVEPPTVVVPPGEERSVIVTARGRRPWFGNPISRTIVVEAVSPTVELGTSARFNQRPRIARGAVTALILAGIILLWALIFLVVIDVLGSRTPAAKSVDKGFLDGSTEFSMDNIGGRLSGRVTAASTGDGLERITVEALRLANDGTVGDAAASTATEADGTYTLEALLPGTYRMRYSAQGFTATWCADSTGSRDLTVMPTDPDVPSTTCSVVLAGNPGSLTVTVEVPEGATGDATVTVQQVVPAGATAPPPVTATPQADGTYLAAGLPTPAQFEVRIMFPGFDPQTTLVSLAGGAQPVLDPSTLTAASGVISGSVVDATGAPLGNVTVTLRSGAVERTLLTPTAGGSIGQYRFENLSTPGNYVITFALAGYSSSTRALDLSPGSSSVGGAVTLVGGQGSIRGTVTATTSTGTSTLGGVVVTVTSAEFTAKTATLTGSVGNGTFSLAGLPTPGVYSVSFAAPGFLTEYATVEYTAPGEQVLDISIGQSVAQMRGTVTVNGAGRSGAFVELSDGANVRSTTTSSTPAGAFSFLDVPPGAYTLTFWIVHDVQGVVQPPVAAIRVRLVAGQQWTEAIDIPGSGP